MTFGKRFKLVRQSKKLSQKQAAELIGIKNYQLANYEANRSEPSIKVLIRMAEVYEVSVDILLGITKQQKQAEEMFDRDLMEQQAKETRRIIDKFIKEYESLHKKNK